MRARAAILWGAGQPWSVEDIELDPPQASEVLVRIEASGLCHSDQHVAVGDSAATLPTIGGHEGAGVIEQVGPGVTNLAVGDRVVFSFIPACGRCYWCSIGRQNLCDLGAYLMKGAAINGGHRAHARGQDIGTLSLVGSFANYAVVHETSVVKLTADVPFEQACLLGCAVPTGWGSAVYAGGVQPGESVVVVGIGGIGANAVQAAALAGARHVVAVDPVEFKRAQAKKLGATHTAASMAEARDLVNELTWGVQANLGILSVGLVTGDLIQPFLDLVSKGGRGVLTGLAEQTANNVKLPMKVFAMWEKRLQGTVYGGCSPRADIPRLAALAAEGRINLSELVTSRYRLDDINNGYADMMDGKNIRGVIIHEH